MSIRDKYEAALKELMDLGLRNSLLNYRHSSARGVRVQGESSAEIFEILTRKEKAMTFVPRKGLEVDLSPHLTNAVNQMEDLPRWPGQIADPAQLADLLKTLSGAIDRVVRSHCSVWVMHPPRLARLSFMHSSSSLFIRPQSAPAADWLVAWAASSLA